MGSLTIEELPPAPEGKTGWPWTEGSAGMPPFAPNGKPWPKISIVTPSFNQGCYLEETIRSVLLQGYPNLEYLIMDGGSTDNSVAIIRKYEPWLSGWVSERDKGQSDALNKGFARTTGEIFNWVCSDDLLAKGSLHTVASRFVTDPDCDVLAGSCYCLYEDEPEKNEVKPCLSNRIDRMPYAFGVWQPSCFFRRRLISRPELVQRDLHYCMDRELWCFLYSKAARWKWSTDTLSVNRYTGTNKSAVGRKKIIGEIDKIYCTYVKDRVPLTFWLRRFWLPLACAHKRQRSHIKRMALRLVMRVISLNLHACYSRECVRVLQDEFYMYSVW